MLKKIFFVPLFIFSALFLQNVHGMRQGSRLLASGFYDGTVRLWDTQTGECVKVLEVEKEKIEADESWLRVLSVAFNPANSNFLAAGYSDNTIRIWNIKTGKCVQTLRGHTSQVSCVAFDPFHPYFFASGSYDHTVRVWDTRTGECVTVLKDKAMENVFFIAFDPRNKNHLISGSFDRFIRIWDFKKGMCVKNLKMVDDDNNAFITSVALDLVKNNRFFCGNSVGKIFVGFVRGEENSFETLKSCFSDGASNWPIRALTFNDLAPHYLASAYRNKIKIWDVKTEKLVNEFDFSCDVQFFTFDPVDPNCLIAGLYDGKIIIWDIEKEEQVKILGGHKITITSLEREPITRGQEDIDEPERIKFMIERPKEPGEEKEVEIFLPEQKFGEPRKKITFPGVFN